MTLRELRIRYTSKKNEEKLDSLLGDKQKKWYIERNYMKIKLFKYLLFLRSHGVNINKFLDEILSNKDE